MTMLQEAALAYLRRNGPTDRALADDERQAPEGCLWAAFETLARLGLVVIEAGVARVA